MSQDAHDELIEPRPRAEEVALLDGAHGHLGERVRRR